LAAIIAFEDAHRTSGRRIWNAANKPNGRQALLASRFGCRVFQQYARFEKLFGFEGHIDDRSDGLPDVYPLKYGRNDVKFARAEQKGKLTWRWEK
jgi:hypothetical protein